MKSSLFGKSYGIEALERQMTRSGEDLKAKGLPANLRSTVAALLVNSQTGGEFRADLREKGIDLILRYGNGGRLFGATFIDHNFHTVLNGSALGKGFAANALSERFPDIATESRENKRAPQPTEITLDDWVRTMQGTLSDERNKSAAHTVNMPASASPDEAAWPTTSRGASHSTSRATYDDQVEAAHSAIPDLSPLGNAAGSLLSILTPDPGGQADNNQPVRKLQPKKPKKGRSV